MQYSEEEKRQRVRSLCDMFASSHTEQQVQEVCEDCNWNEHNCVERLIATQSKSQPLQMAGNDAVTAKNMMRGLSAKENQQQLSTNNNKMAMPKEYAIPADASHSNNNSQSKHFNAICMKAKAGQRIMILMRGPPGSGKSTLAEALLREALLLEKHDVRDFVCSTDDFFVTNRGYVFNRSKLSEAHEWNERRVQQKAVNGWSPIIVDNTHTKTWEMQAYVKIAVQHGYVLELLEPQTIWCKSASKLAQRNVHGVPRENIQRMLENYEKTSVPELLRPFKNKGTVPLPQLRLQPPLPAVPAAATPTFPPRLQEQELSTANTSFKLNASALSWLPVIEKRAQDNVAPTGRKMSMLDLLRDAGDAAPPQAQSAGDASTAQTFKRHGIGCPNEASTFVLLRQMYPNKQQMGLWDLYVKCNGDVDWAVDILLKEDELQTGVAHYDNEAEQASEQYQCDCSSAEQQSEVAVTPSTTAPLVASKPQRQARSRRNMDPAHKQMQLQIENCFVLSDEQYSEHTRKIRDLRNGILDQPPPPPAEDTADCATNEDDDADDEQQLMEISLGEELVKQLHDAFKHECALGELMLPLEQQPMTSKMFVPRMLAKQLYMLWMEAVYNQIEEQRQQTLRDDEQFARLLKHPKYAECSESPSNVNELLDMELAWSIYNSEQQAAQQATARAQPDDIATHLTKMKLCEKFPDVPSDTVLEVFAATGSNYSQTMNVLGNDVQSALTGKELYAQALREREKLSAQEAQLQQKTEPSGTATADAPRPLSVCKSPQLHEEAKCAALRDFEETRNLAAHHAQLKAECYLKAKHAVQQGNGSCALYYSEIAQLHKQKIDVFNHRAANCIMEVHKHTQNNPDLLDLHYLHAMEAISCLDLFLDRHITVLRNCTRVYKHVFIITGRGLHSANGVSTIKNKVKVRLGERRLRWQEVNPGLLKVKVFSASRHAKNF